MISGSQRAKRKHSVAMDSFAVQGVYVEQIPIVAKGDLVSRLKGA